MGYIRLFQVIVFHFSSCHDCSEHYSLPPLFCTGTKGANALEPCPRCHVKGRSMYVWKQIYDRRQVIRVPRTKKDDPNPEAKTLYYGTVARRQRRKKRHWRKYPRHALYWTPLTDPRSPLADFLIDFPIDAMHDVDGHVILNGIRILLTVGFEPGERWKHVTKVLNKTTFWKSCNAWINHWRLWLPSDFARKPRELEHLPKYKMREAHVAGVHLIPALHHIPELWQHVDHALFKNYMKLVVGVLLVCGFSCKPLPKVSPSYYLYHH